MWRNTMWSLLAVTTMVLSGCIAADDVQDPAADQALDAAADIAARLAADVASLPCEADYALGTSSANMMNIFNHTPEDVRYGELDVIEGTDLVVASRYGGGGFDIFDASNPYEPEIVSAMELASYSLDIKVSDDGKTLVSGDFGRFEVIDISNLAEPVVEGWVEYPELAQQTSAQAHMLHFANISGEQYLFAASQWGQGVLIYHMAGDPGAREFHFINYFAPAIGGPIAAHDMMVYHDPIEEKPILWVANGFGGFIAADVSNPSTPTIVSYSPEADPYQGYTHTVSVTVYDGKRYMASMAELGAMALKIYDVTNMATPILLGTWTIQDVPTSTQHNTQILGDWLWLGHYSHGVIKFNLREIVDNVGALPAYNMGPLSEITPFSQWTLGAGSTWESIMVNGVHYTTNGGLWVTLDGCHAAGDDLLDAYV